MDDENKYYLAISALLLTNSALLLLKFLPSIVLWSTNDDDFVFNLLGLLWPIMGLSAAFEFLRCDRDKWGWGGILFHFFVYYCGIYYTILTIISLFSYSNDLEFIISFVLNICVASIGWLTYIFYYD